MENKQLSLFKESEFVEKSIFSKAFKLDTDCYMCGYFRSKLGVARYIAQNEQDMSQWFDSYSDYLDLVESEENGTITWEQYVDRLSENCIYVEEIEIIED